MCLTQIALPGIRYLYFFVGDFAIFIFVYTDMAKPVYIVMISQPTAAPRPAAMSFPSLPHSGSWI